MPTTGVVSVSCAYLPDYGVYFVLRSATGEAMGKQLGCFAKSVPVPFGAYTMEVWTTGVPAAFQIANPDPIEVTKDTTWIYHKPGLG